MSKKSAFVLAIIAILSSHLLAAQYAIVKGEKVPAYADMALHFPVAYLDRGQVIVIGDKFHYRNKLASTIIGKKIVFVEVENLKLEQPPGFPKDPKVAQEIREFLERKEQILAGEKEKNPRPVANYKREESVFLEQSVSFNYFNLIPQSLATNNQEVDSRTMEATTGHFFLLEYKMWPWARFGPLVGFEAFFLDNSLFSLKASGLRFGGVLRVFELLKLRLNLKASLFVAPFAQLKVGNSNASFPTFLYGANAGGEFEYLFSTKWGGQVGADYYLTTIPSKDYDYRGNTKANFPRTDLRGYRAYAGLLYLF